MGTATMFTILRIKWKICQTEMLMISAGRGGNRYNEAISCNTRAYSHLMTNPKLRFQKITFSQVSGLLTNNK